MGRLSRAASVALLAALFTAAWAPARVAAFTGFGSMTGDGTYGVGMTFTVEIDGAAPDRLELLLRLAGDEGTFVAPVQVEGSRATYAWDADERHLTPNTRVAYRWRATDGGSVTLSPERTLLYDDDRPGLDWQSARLGEATVHWYGGAEAQARRFGELSADGAARAEALLGHQLAGPIDIFVYDTQDDFFGALGPGAREWIGAATYPHLRTIFMWLGGGDAGYRETTVVHEVTHVVFDDATRNPFHEPAKWFNEGIASWSERQSADEERSVVEFEADGGGLFAFEAIREQFPIGSRGATLSYAQGATMVDMIIAEHGAEAIAGIAAAYRDGASDDEALEAGTGVAAEQLYAAFYDEFGVEAPQAIEAAPIPPSDVRLPGGTGPGDGSGTGSPQPGATSVPAPGGTDGDGSAAWLVIPAVLAIVVAVGLLARAAARRAGRREPS
ncbi:MAG: peptidase MA family metallohydrolase [Candidatus Limnocylindria bacterium]